MKLLFFLALFVPANLLLIGPKALAEGGSGFSELSSVTDGTRMGSTSTNNYPCPKQVTAGRLSIDVPQPAAGSATSDKDDESKTPQPNSPASQ